MTTENIYHQIAEIEREIAILPEGNITKKRIKDKDYYYLRISRNGKRIENYISFEELPELKEKIGKRKTLEKQLKELRQMILKEEKTAGNTPIKGSAFKTTVRIGGRLEAQIAITRKYKKRECISVLRDYIFGSAQDKVLVLYGLRRSSGCGGHIGGASGCF